MSLLDALKESPKARPTHRVAEILSLCSDEERTAIETTLRDAVWSSERLADVLSSHGHKVSESSVRRYRRDVLGMKG